ncbi:DUF2333 family protein [Idiomarina xiamenensis]|uniref:DUF2333 domain-containing protein n=1 Tax=Idiomarina xiamenensis 10-D-4 TaxID=740709 RepID=K2LC56_9GAMM|nr:DUF2333 family protein [Idiomarina xiamenensis]EKE87435.1 hypothetical protein A10D4_00025 [Idiomarina xiamenensis 10-D-4]
MKHLNWRWLIAAAIGLLLLAWLLSWYFSREPEVFNVVERAQADANTEQSQLVSGYVTTTALIGVMETLLDKPGGFIANDVMPPFIFMDNMPAFEFGALEMSRDLALAMRREFSRSQSQSIQNTQLTVAQPALNIDHTSWLMPSAESEYREAIKQLRAYRLGLADGADYSAQFFARADNLRAWLTEVDKRLGSLSQRLSASVARADVSIAGEQSMAPTSWWQIDDIFYEARGATWALLHFLRAIEHDFAAVLEDKNAMVSLRQIIRELEATQASIWSPMILNGSGFGFMANHSLVMANFISRADAALIDLRDLLAQG